MLLARRNSIAHAVGLFANRGRQRSACTALERQSSNLNMLKREKWTEADIEALPDGEHDYFERKSGRLFSNPGDLLGALAKALSAMANSGGGHIILGVDDSGIPDGIPPMQGASPTRDWLEQKTPHLVEYPLSDFRVHVVEPALSSRFPSGRQVIVIDVGDSPLAPHQCAHGGSGASKYMYYHRRAGRSEPAPHFYVELLRQRLVGPVLEAALSELVPVKAVRVGEAVFLAMRLRFTVKNVGRVAAYKWQLALTEMGGYLEGRLPDYRYRTRDYPEGWSMPSSIRLDDTILPGCATEEDKDFGVFLRPTCFSVETISDEIESLIRPLVWMFRVATEVSPGTVESASAREIVDARRLAAFIISAVGSPQTV